MRESRSSFDMVAVYPPNARDAKQADSRGCILALAGGRNTRGGSRLSRIACANSCPLHSTAWRARMQIQRVHPERISPAMPVSIFLSYARGHDELFVKRLHADLTKAGFTKLFGAPRAPWRSPTRPIASPSACAGGLVGSTRQWAKMDGVERPPITK